jgi:hypothetical protein
VTTGTTLETSTSPDPTPGSAIHSPLAVASDADALNLCLAYPFDLFAAYHRECLEPESSPGSGTGVPTGPPVFGPHW